MSSHFIGDRSACPTCLREKWHVRFKRYKIANVGGQWVRCAASPEFGLLAILVQLALLQNPVVTFGSRQVHKRVTVPETDDEDGSFRLTSHLIELRHRRIGPHSTTCTKTR